MKVNTKIIIILLCILLSSMQFVNNIILDEDEFFQKMNIPQSADCYTLNVSSYLGGGGDDYVRETAVDSQGNIFLTGRTISTDFPTTSGAYDQIHNGEFDIFISKLNPNGTILLSSTFLGGSANENVNDIFIDDLDNIYLTGSTGSTDFPTSSGAYDTSLNGTVDGFICKFSNNLTVLNFSTYFGGNSFEFGREICVDSFYNSYVTGTTDSSNFPTSQDAIDNTYGGNDDAFILKISRDGTDLNYSSYVGGSDYDIGTGIAVDSLGFPTLLVITKSTNLNTTEGVIGETHFGSYDVYLCNFNLTSSQILYSTYFGGDYSDSGAMYMDNYDNIYLCGLSSSTNFPLSPKAIDTTKSIGNDNIFISKISKNATSIEYSTYCGSVDDGSVSDIVVDSQGNAIIVGTAGFTLPITYNAFFPEEDYRDGFIIKINTNATEALYCTTYGGDGTTSMLACTTTPSDKIVFVGNTNADDLPVTDGAYDGTINGGSYDTYICMMDITEGCNPSDPNNEDDDPNNEDDDPKDSTHNSVNGYPLLSFLLFVPISVLYLRKREVSLIL